MSGSTLTQLIAPCSTSSETPRSITSATTGESTISTLPWLPESLLRRRRHHDAYGEESARPTVWALAVCFAYVYRLACRSVKGALDALEFPVLPAIELFFSDAIRLAAKCYTCALLEELFGEISSESVLCQRAWRVSRSSRV